MGQPQFTYLFYDLTTGTKLAELPLKSVKYGDILNGAGAFNAQLHMTDKRVKKALQYLGGDTGSVISAGKTEVYVDMDGDLDWGGILWTARYASGTRSAQLGGLDFWSYFGQGRRISWNADYTAAGVGPMDQLLIFKDLIDKAQAVAGGDIGVITSGVTPSDHLLEVKWDASQLTQFGSAVSTLAQQSGVLGFDFAINVAYENVGGVNVPRKYLTLSYPRRGRIAGLNNLSFDTGNKWAQPYSWPEDATAMANVMYGIGAGTGPATAANQGGLRSTQAYTAALDNGYPLLEGTMQRSDVTRQDLLDNMTATQLASRAYPVALPTVAFGLDMPDPQYGSYICGDDAELVIEPDEWFSNGYSEFKRISAWDVAPADDGGVGTVALNFIDPPLFF